MKYTIVAAIIAFCATTAFADVPACSDGSQVDGENPIGPWTEESNCENACYFEENDSSSPNYQMQCKGVCQYAVPACGTSVCPSGYYTCTPES